MSRCVSPPTGLYLRGRINFTRTLCGEPAGANTLSGRGPIVAQTDWDSLRHDRLYVALPSGIISVNNCPVAKNHQRHVLVSQIVALAAIATRLMENWLVGKVRRANQELTKRNRYAFIPHAITLNGRHSWRGRVWKPFASTR